MAIPIIPTVKEIKARIVADLDNKLNQVVPDFPKAFNKVLAGAIAGLILLLYKSILWVYRQIFPSTADEVSLKLLGAIVKIFQLPAEFAILQIEVPGNESYIPPQDTEFKSPDGFVYKITTTTAITGGIAVCQVTALQSGEASNQINGTELSIIKTDSQLLGIATVTDTISSGDDAEDIDSFRLRVTGAYQKRKTGGAPADYEAWALETPNVNWASPLDNPDLPGDVIVYIKVDNQVDGIPTPAQLDEVLQFLLISPVTGIRDRHPIGPYPIPTAITRREFDVTVFVQDATSLIKDDIEEAMRNYVETREPYNIAISLIRKDTISKGAIADSGNDVAQPQGAIVIDVNLSQVTPFLEIQFYQLFGGEFGKLRNVTFTDIV